MKAVMYHYVRPRDPAFPNFRFLHVGNFRRQLDHFAQEHGFVTRAEWAAFVLEGRLPADLGKIILTFDDALSCHYSQVFPELVRRDLWGIFYVPTGPYTAGGLLDVHRIHLLCGASDGATLWSHARERVTPDMVPFARRAEFQAKTYRDQDNADGVSDLKRLLNYFIDEALRTAFIDRLAADFSLRFDPATFYAPAEALAEMARAGMLIGAHSRSHPVMSKLSAEEQANEIGASLDWVRATVGHQTLITYCHPFGGFHSFDAQTLRLLNEMGVDFSFNVEPRDIVAADIDSCRHALPRYDCNLFPHGLAD